MAGYALALPLSGTLMTGAVSFALISAQAQATDYSVTTSAEAGTAAAAEAGDTITFDLLSNDSTSYYLPNDQNDTVTYAADIIIQDLYLANGYSGSSATSLTTYVFTGSVTSDTSDGNSGNITFGNWSSSSCFQSYVFQGDMSQFTGDITSQGITTAYYSGGLSLVFEGDSSAAASGKGLISLSGTSGESLSYNFTGETTIANGSISAPIVNFNSTGSYTLNCDLTTTELNVATGATLTIANTSSVTVSESITGTVINNGNVSLSGNFSTDLDDNFDSSSIGSVTLSDCVLDLSGGLSTSSASLDLGNMSLVLGTGVELSLGDSSISNDTYLIASASSVSGADLSTISVTGLSASQAYSLSVNNNILSIVISDAIDYVTVDENGATLTDSTFGDSSYSSSDNLKVDSEKEDVGVWLKSSATMANLKVDGSNETVFFSTDSSYSMTITDSLFKTGTGDLTISVNLDSVNDIEVEQGSVNIEKQILNTVAEINVALGASLTFGQELSAGDITNAGTLVMADASVDSITNSGSLSAGALTVSGALSLSGDAAVSVSKDSSLGSIDFSAASSVSLSVLDGAELTIGNGASSDAFTSFPPPGYSFDLDHRLGEWRHHLRCIAHDYQYNRHH